MTKKTLITIEKLDSLCQLQAEITQSKLEIQKNFNTVNQIFHISSIGNYIENYCPQIGSTTNFFDSQETGRVELQQVEIPLKNQPNKLN